MSNKRNKRKGKKTPKTTNAYRNSKGRLLRSEANSKVSDLTTKLSQAIACHQNNQLDDARLLYESVIREQPDHPDALHFYGILLCHEGKTDIGEPLIRKAINMAPDYYDAHNNLGNILQLLGRLEEAEEIYLRATTLKPTAVDPLNNLAALRLAQNDVKGSEQFLAKASTIAPTDPNTHRLLANVEQNRGNLDQALAHLNSAYEHATGNSKKHILTTKSNLLISMGQKQESIRIYQEWLIQHPGDKTVEHLLAALLDGPPPERPDEEFVKQLFDGFALSFDKVLEKLEYQAPDLIKQYIESRFDENSKQLCIVDAGCGTGLCGSFLRPFAESLVGVDLSPAMLNRARIIGHYDELIEDDLNRFFEDKSKVYDLIISADTLVYLGELERILSSMGKSLRTDAELIFTLELDEAPNELGYRLQDHGRYSHAKEYVIQSLDKSGFTLTHLSENILRMERGEPVRGMLIAATAS